MRRVLHVRPLLKLLEEQRQRARDETTIRVPLDAARDREGFTAPRLAVGKDGGVDAVQRRQHRVARDVLKHFVLRCLAAEDAVEPVAVARPRVVHILTRFRDRNIVLHAILDRIDR